MRRTARATTKAKAPDRRVGRTRRHLREALVALILERGWDEVSVQDVCARADIGRSTFYTHFADKEELLLSGFDDLHASLEGATPPGREPFAFARSLLEHAKDNHRLFRAVVGKRSGAAVQRRFRDVVAALVEAELARLGIGVRERTPLVHYVSGGFTELLMHWLERPAGVDAATLAASFLALTRGALTALGR